MSSYKDGKTALAWAGYNGNYEVAKILFDAGANMNIQDKVSTRIGFIYKHILTKIIITENKTSFTNIIFRQCILFCMSSFVYIFILICIVSIYLFLYILYVF